jgi:diamine N-acetyltransferase
VVVTNRGYSDWSTRDFASSQTSLHFRLALTGEDVLVETSEDGRSWEQLRLAHLDNPTRAPLQAGLYACCPVDSGYQAEFDFLRISRPVDSSAPVSLREIDEDSVWTVIQLSETLSEEHRHMVAPNAVSIAQAHFSKYAWFRAIYAGEDLVGFVMVYIGPDEEKPDHTQYFLWRYMIAAPYQKHGFGRKALEQVMQMAREKGAKEFYLSCGEGKGSPEGFYQKLGFRRTGRIVGGEVVMVTDL